MERGLRLVSDACVFAAGLVVGSILTIFGCLPLITAESKVEEINALLLLPTMYYIVAVVVLSGMALLLRRAADRVI
jgi:hypothetical protein